MVEESGYAAPHPLLVENFASWVKLQRHATLMRLLEIVSHELKARRIAGETPTRAYMPGRLRHLERPGD